ncbi:MAG: cytidylate kinase-like family protein [Oscillospiraceae bacterium]|nr:cytidylate kinase-like family protein [Oscillospiraceae bacterium]
MEKQVIITVGREGGSGGLEVARKLAEKLGITIYDKNIFEHISERFDIDTTNLQKYDETPRIKGITRTVKGFSNSPEQQVVEMQRQFLREKAEEGQSFVVLGRAGIKTLLDYPCLLIRVFVKADQESKIKRIMDELGYDEKQAAKYISWVDFKRKNYHNQFCHVKWGDPASYDIILKSDRLGIDGTAEFLADYVRRRMANV